MQAETGFMSLNGYPDQPGVRTGSAIMDIASGMMATAAELGALVARERLDRGQRVEVALFDTATLMLGFHAMNYLACGRNQIRFGNTSPDSAPVGVFNAADGPIYVACANDRTFQRLMEDVLARADLADDPDFKTNADRVRNGARLTALIEESLGRDSRAHWVNLMREAAVPAGTVRTIEEAMASAEMRSRGLVSEIGHPTAGPVSNIAARFRFSATPVVYPVAAPILGQHSRSVLARTLGYDDERIDALSASGALGGH